MRNGGTSEKKKTSKQSDSFGLHVRQTLEGLDRCSLFLGLIQKAGLDQHLSGAGPFTILAPQDDSIKNLPTNLFQYITRDKHRLRWFVNMHIIADRVNKEDIGDMQVVKTASGELLNSQAQGPDILIDGVRIVVSDIQCRNGIIQIMEGMLWPK
jgi:uncharacterized surface protein with fasciclin (FAS1) repeats